MRDLSPELAIIAAVYPPVGGGHSERTVGYVKQWTRAGVRARVFTIALEDTDAYPCDFSQFHDVDGVLEVWRVSTLRRAMLDRAWAPRRVRKASVALINLLSVPDMYRYWAHRVVRLVKARYSDKPLPVVYTTSAPYSVHCAGLRLKSWRPGVRWVADFRDAYTTNYRVPPAVKLPLLGALHRQLEQRIYDLADAVILNTPENLRQITRRFRIRPEKFHVIPNGYDPDAVVPELREGDPRGPLRLMYVGGLRGDWFEGDFYRGLARMRERFPEEYRGLEVHLVGAEAPLGDLHARLNLADVLRPRGFRPRSQVQALLAEADALLVLLPESDAHEGCVPQKIYNYMVSGRPVLAIVPAGQARECIEQARLGVVRAPRDTDGIAAAIAKLVRDKRAGTLSQARDVNTDYINGFSKAVLSERFLELFFGRGENAHRPSLDRS